MVWQVDISTMLEEAVTYVKFLQLQIKVREKSKLKKEKIIKFNIFAIEVARESFFLIMVWIHLIYYVAFELRRPLDVCSSCLQWNGYWIHPENFYTFVTLKMEL